MVSHLKKAFFVLIVVFVLLALFALFTNALSVLSLVEPWYFVLACISFLLSILVWVVSWAFLIRKEFKKAGFGKLVFSGFCAVYASLTPIQLGAEAVRVIFLKDFFGIPYTKGVSFSFIVKGLKFFLLALVAFIVILFFLLSVQLEFHYFVFLLLGFLVILAATAMFLLPLKKSFGLRIARIFAFFGKRIKWFKKPENFFIQYSEYLKKISVSSLAVIFVLAIISWFFEFLALQFAFVSFNMWIPLHSVLVLFVLISILERVPFLPRGIGLVEFVGFAFMSVPEFISVTLYPQQIVAVIIVFDFARLVVPTVFSMFLNLFSRKLKRFE
ncbi:MAG: lysylphosphatidylglycerol synthase transmembrane domain-containing protein [archaeon]